MKNLLFLAMLVPGLAYSITVNVNITNCGVLTGSQNDPSTQCGQMKSEIENTVNSDLPDVSINKYADGVANANSFAIKGQGSDYAENFSYFVIKPSFGLAYQGDMSDPETAEGVGLGAAMTVGLNLDLLPIDKIGPVDFSKLDLFVSFMSYNVDQDQDQTSFEGDIGSFAVMARYRLIDSVDIVPGYMLEWGGLHIHTGLQRSSMDLNLTQSFDDESVTSNGQTVNFTDAAARFSLESATTSIPLEFSTYLRMAYVLTVYGGAGMDFVSGSSDIDLNTGGNLSGTGVNSSFAGTISAAEGADGKPEATNFRAFAGVQFNIPFVRVYAQVNKALGSDLIGANAGLKLTW